jgi:hypothetical protein
VATVVHAYVDTASTAGGDGTTNAITGANRAYASLSAAATARIANLVTADQQLVIHCRASTGVWDSGLGYYPSPLNSYTVDATHFITITADAPTRHNGVWNDANYTLHNFSRCFDGPPSYTVIDGLQMEEDSDDNNISFTSQRDGTRGVITKNCIGRFKQFARTYGTGANCIHFGVSDRAGPASGAVNNLFYDLYLGGSQTYADGIMSIAALGFALNNTLIGAGGGNAFQDNYDCVTLKNNIAVGFSAFGASAYDTTYNPMGASDYNATDLATGDGGSHSRVSQTFTFVNSGSKQYQIAGTDAGAKGFGVDLSADATFPFSTDIAGSTRTAPWDIGAFMAAAGAASSLPPLIRSLQLPSVMRASLY